MDIFINNNHLGPLPRKHPHPFPVETIGYVKKKTNWVDHAFTSLNFSFILAGEGVYRMDGREYRVKAPCVITQWPNVYTEYGPKKYWEELFIIYPAHLQGGLEAMRLAARGKPMWYIGDPGSMHRLLAELAENLSKADAPGMADRIDRLCETLVMESLLNEGSAEESHPNAAIERIRAQLEAQPEIDHDLDELALAEGLSPATFRRYWSRSMALPPGRYLMQARIQRACRLLVETDLPVGEVSARMGFRDPLYFSRRFRQVMGMTASRYRRRHRNPLSLAEAD